MAQRPDVRAREALLHQASAEIGVATANMLPQITLTGEYGGTSTRAADLFKSTSNVWSAGAGLTQPIFHGGELLHKKRFLSDQQLDDFLYDCIMEPVA